MSAKFVCLTALVAVTLARPDDGYNAPAPSYNAPHRPSYSASEQYADTAPVYDTQYAVRDDYSGVEFGQNEARNGYDTEGSYYVALPDGRIQKVTYYVNGDSGYVAQVTYEGEAQYPDHQSYQPAPAYNPAPAYSPAPAVYH